MRFPCVKVEGGLLAPDLLDRIYDGAAPGQSPADFGLNSRLESEIAAAWQEALEHWEAFQHRLERLPETDAATTVTRDQWVIPLLSLLGYELVYTPRAAEVEGKTYAISHRAGTGQNAPPVHVVGCRQPLDRRPEAGRPRLAPHSLVQEFLNRSEHLWGMVTNGFALRLLRQTTRLTRPTYIEIDLREMMAGKNFADFSLFYRLAHRSRLPQDGAADCWLERYYQETIEQGGRVRDRLRDGVEEAIKILGQAFLQHPANESLREKVRTNRLDAGQYYQELLRIIYRLLFLMVAEERDLLTTSDVCRAHYSVSRLRRLCENRRAYNDYTDLWESVKLIFRLLSEETLGAKLGLPPLNGPLFDARATADLNDLKLTNRAFLEALWYLSMYKEDGHAPWRRVNYAALDVEELGSVYESLLEYYPGIQSASGMPDFALLTGTERKSTGSYYTPRALVDELVASALVPVMQEKLAGKNTREEKEAALLSLKVCDPASGSGHFLLAAARRLGLELARIRSEADEPSPEQVREAVRDVITHCLYGVDKNPMAVELCKVALWIEGHAPGKPLTFLDHRIRCGDSLVGVFDLAVLEKGIPDEAYAPVEGDDKAVARSLVKQNKQDRLGQLRFRFPDTQHPAALLGEAPSLLALPDDAPEVVRRKAKAYQEARREGTGLWRNLTACHLWTAAFFARLNRRPGGSGPVPLTGDLRAFLSGSGDTGLVAKAWRLAEEHRFFHWPLEFPEVFREGGFDVVLCNPPWEQIELHEEEFFAPRHTEIARSLNKAERQKLIRQLPATNPALWEEYVAAKHAVDALSKFLRGSGRFPLTACGRINTYSVFAELFARLIRSGGRAGVVLPTGIATDDTNKQFFAAIMEARALISLWDFKNHRGLFPSVAPDTKFCLFTIQNGGSQKSEHHFAFFLTDPVQIRDDRRVFTLSLGDLRLLNPNTRTCPVFRTREDAELTKKIYRRVPVLVDEDEGENPWGVTFKQGLFNMSSDSHLFCTTADLEHQGYRLVRGRDLGRPDGPCFVRGREVWLPLYEAKMIWQFDHRFGTYAELARRQKLLPTPSEEEHANPGFFVLPWYWVPAKEVELRLSGWQRGWVIGFRNVTDAMNERTAIFTVLPRVGVGNSTPLALPDHATAIGCLALTGNLGALVFDYVSRMKIAGTNMNFFFVKQLPVFPPDAYSETDLLFIVPRVLELVYTAWDLEPFARDVWQESTPALRQEIARRWEECCGRQRGQVHRDTAALPPFRWNAERRARIRAELDAYYAKLYGLTRDELRYILDPKDVFGPNFPGETFRVLKEKEERQYGEYRTRRLVLEAWNRLFG
ncbi:MAG TPA: N-6 DNA methylase [Firmicutes bacterium]|nr:N-6 DNA methylase [Bacillota bacterium]